MKTKLTRRIALTALALLLLCGTALAANTVQQMQIRYMNIKLVVDGAEVTPKDAAGRVVEPFVSDGTTYLPVRAVAAALGKDVEWDGKTNTVYIGKNIPGKSTNWMTEVPPYNLIHTDAYDGTDAKNTFKAGGKDQTQGLVMKCQGYYNKGDGLLYETSTETYNSSTSWNPNGQYQTMRFTVEHMSGEMKTCRMDILVDEVLYQSVDLVYDGPAKTVNIPLNGATSVTVKLFPPQEHDASLWRDVKDALYALYNISFE